MSKVRAWLSGWGTTLHIMIFERETYRLLREPMDPADFEEVPRPEDPEELDAGADS